MIRQLRHFVYLLALIFVSSNFAWAGYESFDKLPADSQSELVKSWLFQVNGAVSIEAIADELKWSREAAERIGKMQNAPDFTVQLGRLNELENRLKSLKAEASDPAFAENCKSLYLDLRKIKRDILFSNPLIDFDSLLLIDNPYPHNKPGDAFDEWAHEARHRNGIMATDGGRMLIAGLNPGEIKSDVLASHPGAFWRPDLSFDGKEILFCFKPQGEKVFHLYKVNVDGSNFRQLTFGDYDDLDPIYAPDDHIIFCSTRQHTYVRCMPYTHSFAVSRCNSDGTNIYVISANGEPEYSPCFLPDGRVIYTRWEYTEKALWRMQSLWTMNPDGTNSQTFWGNQSVWPDLLTDSRPIPGSNKVAFVAAGHHAVFDGTVGYIDSTKGLNYPDGLEWITRETAWPELGGGWYVKPGRGPQDPPPSYDYHTSGKYYAYKSPYPLSEEYMLVSIREGGVVYSGSDHDWFFRLYLMDVYGNKELIQTFPHSNAWYAMPLKSRPRPAVKPDCVKWPQIGIGEQPAPGYVYSNNVFDNAPSILKEKGKAIRVVQMDPKNYSTWYKSVSEDGPAVSMTQADGVKRILGSVPIEADGSVYFELPSGKAVYFEMLDENGMAIHVMRSFTYVLPGEVRGCFGCHESNLNTRGNTPSRGMSIAMKKGPQKLTPPTWGAEESISFARFVQKPVLDKYCAKCHQNPESEAFKRLNMTSRPSSRAFRTRVNDRPDDTSPFTEPYQTLVGAPFHWGNRPMRKNDKGVFDNLAGVLIVEGFGWSDPASYKTLQPYSCFSPTSKLVENACSGNHHDVKVTGEDRQRLIAWVDANGPYLGDEEIRQMYDPDCKVLQDSMPPVRPRVATAPHINRFDIRQDGNSELVCGTPRYFIPGNMQSKMPEENRLNVEILSAQYGLQGVFIDVTQKVKSLYKDKPLLYSGRYSDLFGDPIKNTVKQLNVTVKYRSDGSTKTFTFTQDADIIIPAK